MSRLGKEWWSYCIVYCTATRYLVLQVVKDTASRCCTIDEEGAEHTVRMSDLHHHSVALVIQYQILQLANLYNNVIHVQQGLPAYTSMTKQTQAGSCYR